MLSPDAVDQVLVRAPNWIGDAVMALPALVALRRWYAAARLEVIARAPVAEVMAAGVVAGAGVPIADAVHTAQRGSGWRRLGALWRDSARLRAATPAERGRQLAVLLPNSFEAALFGFFVGAGRRLGYSGDARSLLLTDRVRPAPRRQPAQHHSEYYLELLRAVGIEAASTQPRLMVAAAGASEARALLETCGVGSDRGSGLGGPDEPVVALHAGAAFGSAKRWPPERFSALARKLIAQHGARILLVGAGADEVELARTIAAEVGAGAASLAGLSSLSGLLGILARADLLVTNDSGPMHLAAALGTPTVAIFGPTDPDRTAVLGRGHRVITQRTSCSPCELVTCPIDHHCMSGITAEEVAGAGGALLAGRGAGCPVGGGR